MSRWTNERARAGLLAGWLRRRLARPQTLWIAPAGLASGAPPARPQPAADWAAQHAQASVDGVVSELMLHHLLVEPGLPLADRAAVQGYARQQFAHYWGAAATRWPLAAWRQVGGERPQAGASALGSADWPALQQALQARGVRLRSLRPAWAALLPGLVAREPDWWSAPQAALAWVEADGGQASLSWLQWRGGRCEQLRHQRLRAPSVEALDEALATLTQAQPALPVLLMGYGLDRPRALARPGLRQPEPLDGVAPRLEWFAASAGEALPAPDFIERPPRPSPLSLALAATALAVLGVAGWEAWQQHQRLDALQAQAQTLRARAGAAAPTAARKTARLEPGAAGVAQARAALEHPWGRVLSDIEHSGADQAQLAWLALDHAAGRPELRLEGVAADRGQALQLADRLAARAGWRDVVLARLQQGEPAQGPRPRFEIQARVQGAPLAAGAAR